jgi:hypothetical protein
MERLFNYLVIYLRFTNLGMHVIVYNVAHFLWTPNNMAELWVDGKIMVKISEQIWKECEVILQ